MSRPAIYASQAEKQAAYRARKGATVTVLLDTETKAALDAYLDRQRRDGDTTATLSSVVAKLVRTQLLRKR